MKHPYIYKILTIVQTIFVIIYICLMLIKCQVGNTKSYLFNFNTMDWFTLIKITCWIIIFDSITLILFSVKKRYLYLLLKGFAITVIILFITAGVYGFTNPRYYKISSPDHLHVVLVQNEFSIFTSDYYFVDYTPASMLHKVQGSISTHFDIIENNFIDITWHDSFAEIKIYEGNNKILKKFKILYNK